MSIRILIVFFLLSNVDKSYSQNINSFKRIIDEMIIGKSYISKTKSDTSWRSYLGIVYDKATKVKYYVVKEFRKNKASSTWHGHSTVYFINLSKKIVAHVDVGMPDALPYRLSNNTFFFHYTENGSIKNFKSKLDSVHRLFCSVPSGCNEIIFE